MYSWILCSPSPGTYIASIKDEVCVSLESLNPFERDAKEGRSRGTHVVSTENDLNASPLGVLGDLLVNEVLKLS